MPADMEIYENKYSGVPVGVRQTRVINKVMIVITICSTLIGTLIGFAIWFSGHTLAGRLGGLAPLTIVYSAINIGMWGTRAFDKATRGY